MSLSLKIIGILSSSKWSSAPDYSIPLSPSSNLSQVSFHESIPKSLNKVIVISMDQYTPSADYQDFGYVSSSHSCHPNHHKDSWLSLVSHWGSSYFITCRSFQQEKGFSPRYGCLAIFLSYWFLFLQGHFWFVFTLNFTINKFQGPNVKI